MVAKEGAGEAASSVFKGMYLGLQYDHRGPQSTRPSCLAALHPSPTYTPGDERRTRPSGERMRPLRSEWACRGGQLPPKGRRYRERLGTPKGRR
jgi:hypothetical protein